MRRRSVVTLPVMLLAALVGGLACVHGAEVLRPPVGAGPRAAAAGSTAATGVAAMAGVADTPGTRWSIAGSGGEPAGTAASGSLAEQVGTPGSSSSGDVPARGGASSPVTMPRPPVTPMPCPALTRSYLTATPSTFPRTVALTFDDGPGPWTPDFLDVLAKHRVHATFFMVAGRAKSRPDLVARVVTSGNLVGNHTSTHPLNPGLSRLPQSSVVAEISGAQAVLTHLSGSAPCFFRGPGEDHRTLAVLAVAHRYGLTVTDTTRTARDAGDPRNARWDPVWRDLIVTRLTSAGGHPIVLMHDGHADAKVNELSALELIIDWYAARRYVFTDPGGRPFPAAFPAASPAASPTASPTAR
jgi:peptidoglycan/xylan/chitin deacetylase (PgdA/CDA1 family)